MLRRISVQVVAILMFSSVAVAQQFPVLDMVASKVIQKYQNSSCGQLMAQRDEPRSPQEQNMIQMLRDDPQMRREFINRVAAPIANKLFECRMIP